MVTLHENPHLNRCLADLSSERNKAKNSRERTCHHKAIKLQLDSGQNSVLAK